MQPGGPLVTRWFDGQHPRARSVRLRIEGDELLMHTGDEVRHFPLKEVRWPERRSHGQRQTDLPDGGMIQHADAAEWDEWWLAQGLPESAVVGWMQSWRATLASMAGTVVFLAGEAAGNRSRLSPGAGPSEASRSHASQCPHSSRP